MSASALAGALTSWNYPAREVKVMTSVSLWKRKNGTARLEPGGDRGDGGPLGQGEHLWGGQHRHLPAAEGRNGVDLGHGVAGGRRQARLQGHGATLRRTATTGRPRSHNRTEAGPATRARAHEQRQHDLHIGHGHDVIAAMGRAVAEELTRQGLPFGSSSVKRP